MEGRSEGRPVASRSICDEIAWRNEKRKLQNGAGDGQTFNATHSGIRMAIDGDGMANSTLPVL